MNTRATLREARFARIYEMIEAGSDRDAIVTEIGVTRMALSRYCYRYGEPTLGAMFTRMHPTSPKCTRCNASKSTLRGLCQACRCADLPRLIAVEIVRYRVPRGPVGGHVTAYPTTLTAYPTTLTTGDRARIMPLSIYDAQSAFSKWPRRAYHTVPA